MPIPLRTGQILRDRYCIRQVIGTGGMGSIYLAEDNRLQGRLCAIKEVRHETEPSDHLRAQRRDQFYREASVLARLDHPSLPKVSDFFSDEQSDYLVMDYVAGDDLRILLQQAEKRGHSLGQSDILRWASQLGDALTYLHSQEPPVIHRDIKPSNLKLTPAGHIKLVDFGLVKQMAPDEMTITVIQGRGTALYSPLEQYGGDTGHTDPRSDIYSFAATLYHLLTNHPPPEAKQRFLDPDSMQPPRTLNPGISPRVEKAILKALSLHPSDRYQDVPSFLHALTNDVDAPANAPQPGLHLHRLLPTTLDALLAGVALALLLLAALAGIR